MLDIQSISAISTVVAVIGVLVGVVLTVLELRNLVKTRQTDIVLRLHSNASNRETMEAYLKIMNLEFRDYNDLVEKYGLPFSENPSNTAIRMVSMFFDGIGVLLHRKLVDIDLVIELFPVGMIWEKMKPIAEGMRKQFNEPRAWEWFEYLYNEMQKREQRLQQTQQ